jgi:chemotaxis protein CheD
MKTGSVYLQPGEWYFGNHAAVIETVLGSCVAIVARAPGGATFAAHCMLPLWDGNPAVDAVGKFVDRTVEEMLNLFARHGVPAAALEVKLFGGAGVFVLSHAHRALRVGQNNIDTATALLQNAGVRIVARQVGGRAGRKIIVDLISGTVLVRQLRPASVAPSKGVRK